MNLKSLLGFVFLLLTLLINHGAVAADLQWSGLYRAESIFIKNLKLDNSQNQETSYLTHHFVLSPKIVAMDGLNIYSRFDIFNNAMGNNYAGQLFGSYTGGTVDSAGQALPSATMSRTQQSETLAVTELYMNWVNEFSAVVVGRVPFNFGLGMYFSDGHGSFDHTLTTKDILGYRITMGNFYMMPAYGKTKEGFLNNEDDVNDYLFLLEYKNPETDMEIGILYDVRVAPTDGNAGYGNDTPTAPFTFGTTPTRTAGFNVSTTHFYVKRKSDYFNLGLEVGFMNGDTGVTYSGGTKADLAGIGLAGEMSYRMGNITLNLRAGMASGDDQETPRFEGFFFNSNYNIAMLMFNHGMGQYDALRSELAGTKAASSSSSTAVNALSGMDHEVVSNAIYFAPRVTWTLGERYDVFGNFCYAITQKSPLKSSLGGATVGSALGFETDLGLRYHLGDKFTIETQIGVFFPGSAFAAGNSNNFKTDASYGATAKAAIHF